MKVDCQNCHVKINVPDDKLVPGESFAFTCPKCKTKNTVDIPGNDAPVEAPDTEESAAPEEAEEEFEDYGDDDSDAGGFYEEGAKIALICFDEGSAQDQLVQAVGELGYVPVIPESARDAMTRIRVTHFDLILLDKGFDGNSEDFHPIHRFLQPMNMSTRRHIFFALFGEDLKTGDHMNAFKLSVNAVVSLDDEDIFDKVLHKAIADYERFYRVYFEFEKV